MSDKKKVPVVWIEEWWREQACGNKDEPLCESERGNSKEEERGRFRALFEDPLIER